MSNLKQCWRPVQCVMILLALCSAAIANSAAHPVSVTRTFAYVTREQVTAKIEVFLEDLFLFHNLKPNDQDFLEPDVINKGMERHKQFLLKRFVIRDLSGARLDGRVVDVKRFDMQPEGVPLAELMAHKLTFELQYELPAAPEFLTISQHFTDEKGVIPSEMKLVLKQENAGTAHTAEMKPDEPETVRFSWDNPPLSPEASEAEQKKWIAKQKEETLGITSYSSVYSFLYIDDYEVRHEILIPLLTLEESVLIARDEDEFLDIAEQNAARQQIEAYFTAGNPVEIDGVEVKPIVQRCDFYGLDFKDFAKRAERRRVGIASARVGIILSYSTKGSLDSVRLTWNRFNDYIWTINVVVFAFDETSKVTLSRLGKKNVFEWKNPGRPAAPPLKQVNVTLPPRANVSLPVLSLACLILLPAVLFTMKRRRATLRASLLAIVALVVCATVAWPSARWETSNPFSQPPRVSDGQAKAIFASLHKNTYRAFDYRSEDDTYDALAKSIDGALLQELYLQIRSSLEMQEQGGAVSRIREVNFLEGRSDPLPDDPRTDDRGFSYRCRWNVNGTVEHWGHIHARTNQYEALFAVEPRENAWKITSMELLDEKRVKFETTLRGL